jgi:glycosyltransferase involved in cell wall biosynthesis
MLPRQIGNNERSVGNRSMRICYVADGASIHTQRWVNYFARKGHEVHLICWKLMTGYDENIHIHLLTRLAPKIWTASRYLSALLWIFQTRHLIKKIKPDIVDGHFITVYGFLAACSGFHPLVVSSWGSDVLIHPKRNFFLKAITKYALKKADMVTSDAEHLKIGLMELGTEPQKIKLVYFGTDTDKFKPAQRNKKLQEELGIVDSPTVISLRSLEPIYDIDSLIKSIPLVLKEIPEAKFVIAGGGSQEVKLKELARSLGILESIRFVGLIPNEEIPRYLASSDIYVSTSHSDAGLSAATAEAMACGLAVVITEFGDNQRWVKDGENGFIVPLKEPKTLAEKIIYLLRNEDVRMEFGRRNRKIIKERNDYYKEMEKMENIYKEMIERYKS